MRYLVLLLLAGCATVTNSIGTATQLNTAALTAAVSLAQSGAISSKQLAEVTNVTNGVEAALVLAEQASNAGNSATASATYTATWTGKGMAAQFLPFDLSDPAWLDEEWPSLPEVRRFCIK